MYVCIYIYIYNIYIYNIYIHIYSPLKIHKIRNITDFFLKNVLLI